MRPDLLHERRTRTHAIAVMMVVVLFHALLLLSMGLFLLFMSVSISTFVGGAVGLWVAYKALTVRAPVTAPSRLIDLNDYPGLREALEDASLRVGAPMPDRIRLTAASRIYVNEEGGLLGGLFGTRRLLVVGVAAFPFLTETEVRTLLARALAQWSPGEAWYGVQARRVQVAGAMMVEHLGASWTRWFNPVYWLFVGTERAFGRVLASYRRERELWVDEMAARAYSRADAEAAIRQQAMCDAFWLEHLRDDLTGGPTRSFAQVWTLMKEAVLAASPATPAPGRLPLRSAATILERER